MQALKVTDIESFRKGRGRGLVVVNTGGGKGKTSAAIGAAVRATGYGLKVAIVQFIKGSWFYGELEGIKKLEPKVDMIQVGEGFIGIIDDKLPLETHQQAAKEGWQRASEIVMSGAYDLVILDEVNYAMHYKLINSSDVLQLIKGRPKHVDLVLTGNFAPEAIIEAADTVTEMKQIKHAFQKGIKAKRGLDY